MTKIAEEADVPVLVVGGSLVGLSAAMFLAARGVACAVVERHRGSSLHPRAVGYTQRTLELFDTAGLTGIPEAPPTFRLRRVRADSLTGRWHEETDWTPRGRMAEPEVAIEWSPHNGAAIAQDRIEPMLRDRARALGAALHLGTELVRFEDGPGGVTAWLRDADGAERVLRATYLIACDGHRSSVRDALGIACHGVGLLQVMRSVLFRAELEPYQRGVGQFEISQPGLDAFLTTYGDGRWVLIFKDDVERDEPALRAAIEQAIGAPVPFEIVTTGRWELSARIADRYAKGRVFLAGDAAHTLPPTRGGYGANTGIADAYNLAWKLAAVLSGRSDPALLDTYEAERKPIAWLRYEQTFARPDYARFAPEALRSTPILDPIAIELGELYRSEIVIGADAALPAARRPDQWRGQPGTRVPHRRITSDGVPRSTLELLGRGWAVISSNAAWHEAAARTQERLGVAVQAVDLQRILDREDRRLVEADLGIGERGASLVRPDGVVAWRRETDPVAADAADALAAALTVAAHLRA